MTMIYDGHDNFIKFESDMQVYSIKNLMFNNKPVHHEGVMIVSLADSNNKNQPVFIFPYWDAREKKEKMLKISETHLHHLCRGPKNLLVLNLQPSLSIKRVVIVLTDVDDDGDDLEKLCVFLPDTLRPCQCQAATEIPIVELKKHVDQLEDAPLVMQYVNFLGLCKCDDCETSVSMFKRLLESNGPYISRFLKKTIKFKEQDSVVNMLTTYVQSHKCSVDGCPNFTKDKCGKCKTAKYCNVACQKMDFQTHSTNDCDNFKELYVNRVDAFNKMISEVVFAKLHNQKRGGKFLSFLEFTARIKPWVLSGYHDHIVKKTFLLGSIKFSSEKFSNIDISEDTQSLKPLLKYGAELFPRVSRNMMDEMAEISDRSFYFQHIVLMKKLYDAGDLDVSKIKSGDWMDILWEKDDEYRKRFEDEDFASVRRWLRGDR